MKPKLASIAALSVLVLLVAALACSSDGDDNLETPATDRRDWAPRRTHRRRSPVQRI